MVTKRSAILMLVTAAAILLPLASLHLTGNAQANQDDSRLQAMTTATLLNGVTVQLLGIKNADPASKIWWKPDGALLAQSPYDRSMGIETAGDRSLKRQFALHFINRSGGDYKTNFDVEGTGGWASTSNVYRAGKRLPNSQNDCALQCTFPPGQTRCQLRVGVAAGSWQTSSDIAPNGSSSTDGILVEGSPSRPGDITGSLITTPFAGPNGQASIVVTDTLADSDRRVVAVDRQGHIVIGTDPGNGSASLDKMHQTLVTFSHLALKQVRVFRFQTRPYLWTTFQNVALHPLAAQKG